MPVRMPVQSAELCHMVYQGLGCKSAEVFKILGGELTNVLSLLTTSLGFLGLSRYQAPLQNLIHLSGTKSSVRLA